MRCRAHATCDGATPTHPHRRSCVRPLNRYLEDVSPGTSGYGYLQITLKKTRGLKRTAAPYVASPRTRPVYYTVLTRRPLCFVRCLWLLGLQVLPHPPDQLAGG